MFGGRLHETDVCTACSPSSPCSCCTSATASAQVDRATLTGIVRDPSDAVIAEGAGHGHQPGHRRRRDGDDQRRRHLSGGEPAPGEYLVQAEATGFQRFEQTVVARDRRALAPRHVAAGRVDRRDGHGRGRHAAAQHRDPRCSAPSSTATRCEKLPLAIRNWDDLLSLVPGVQSDRYTEQAGGTSAGRTGGVSVHGNRSLQNNFLLDGVDNNSFSTNVQELTTQVSRPSVDAIDEFKVVTSPYAAEYGWSPGAAIIVNTKSGTNSIRGTAYDFFRNDSFDTNNFFAKRANQPKPTNNQNQFGGNLGGPIVQATARSSSATTKARASSRACCAPAACMTADERSGVFTVAIRDPLTGLPFANNTIPADRIDPVAARDRGAGAAAEHRPAATTSSASRTSRTNRDRYLGPRRLHARQQRQRLRPLHLQRSLPLRARASSAACSTAPRRRPGAATTSSRTARSAAGPRCSARTLVNEARFSWARGTNDGTQDPFGEDGNAQIGFTGVPDDPTRRRRHRRHRHRRPHPPRLAELHAEVPAHRPVPVASTR